MMYKLSKLKPEKVFEFFEEISAVPRGSGNMDGVAEYCVNFAKDRELRAVRDGANNVVVYKPATAGYENAEPVILQGHLDIVCQKAADRDIDFEKQGIDIYIDGEFVKANGTTLGADNGIAAAMMLAILDSDDIPHPAIEAVFTTDEEIGMIGAGQLDMSLLHANKMLNLDSEEDDTLTVSCAGGSDFRITVPLERNTVSESEISVTLKGLRGGHSGVEIDKGRVNANILGGRFLNHMLFSERFRIVEINGGDKVNAIPPRCDIKLVSAEPDRFVKAAEEYLCTVKKEISEREPDFDFQISVFGKTDCSVISDAFTKSIISLILCVPNGIQEMSADIEGLVETSLNLGILKTEQDKMTLHLALRSNKASALAALEERLIAFASLFDCEYEAFGHYPPWEYREDSEMQALFKEVYREQTGFDPRVEAIHAGLECGVFASKMPELDCIAIGPSLFDVHTVNERLYIPSVEKVYNILCELLKRCK